MKKTVLLLLFSTLLFSCAPRVFTEHFKSYPPVSETEELTVFHDKEDIPTYAEALGRVNVLSFKGTEKAAVEEAMEVTKSEGRKIGGNGLFVSEHLKPSFWRGNNHQFLSVILRMDSTNSIASQSDVGFFSYKDNYKRNVKKVPRHIFDLSAGFSSFLVKSKHANEADRALKNGINYRFGYHYHHKGSQYGFGLVASKYVGSPFKEVLATYDMQQVYSLGLGLNYVGASFSTQAYMGEDWLLALKIGLGALSIGEYDVETSSFISANYFPDTFYRTLGSHLNISIERKLSKFCSLSCDLGTVGGSFTDPRRVEEKTGKALRVNITRMEFSLGMKFFIN